MDNNTECHFIDKTVTFDQFVNELATMIALRIHQVEKASLKSAKQKRSKCMDVQMLKDG